MGLPCPALGRPPSVAVGLVPPLVAVGSPRAFCCRNMPILIDRIYLSSLVSPSAGHASGPVSLIPSQHPLPQPRANTSPAPTLTMQGT